MQTQQEREDSDLDRAGRAARGRLVQREVTQAPTQSTQGQSQRGAISTAQKAMAYENQAAASAPAGSVMVNCGVAADFTPEEQQILIAGNNDNQTIDNSRPIAYHILKQRA